MRSIILALLGFVYSCQADIPSGAYRCDSMRGCPLTFRCVEGFCVGREFGDADVSSDAGALADSAAPGDASRDGGLPQEDEGPLGNDAGPSGSDAGPSGTDAGPTGSDAGATERDAGPSGTDAGPPGSDAGPPRDAGSPATDAGDCGDVLEPCCPGDRCQAPFECSAVLDDICVAPT